MANAVFLADIRGPQGLGGPAGPGFYLGPAGQFNDIKSVLTMPNGWVTVGDYVNAGFLGLPEEYGGWVMMIAHSASIAQLTFSTFHPDGAHVWTRTKSSGTWASWRRVDAARPPRQIQNGSDMNTFYGDEFIGPWRVVSRANADTVANLPKDSAGLNATTIVDVTGPYGFQTARVYNGGSEVPLMYYRARIGIDNTVVNAWTEWVNMAGGGGSSSSGGVMQNNKARVDAFVRARGGSIGLGGVGAVAMRFDHNMANFRDIILPLLRARNLPWSLAVNTAQNHIDSPANGGVTWAQLQGWALNDGGEVIAHSHTHADSTSTAAITANVTDMLPVLSAGLPMLKVEVFTPPGTPGTNWLGFNVSDTPEHFTTKYAAAGAILNNFAVCTGHIPGLLRPLIGQLTNGEDHMSMDSYTSASTVTNLLAQAQQLGAGVQLMMHPIALSQEGGITTAVLTQLLDWIAAERDAGRLRVLSLSGMLVADAKSGYNMNILRAFGSSIWSSTTGWAVTGATAAGSTGAGVMSGAVSLSNLGHVGGRIRELVVEARSTAGSTLRMGVTGSSGLAVSKSLAIQSGNTWRTYRIPFTIPASATSLTVSLGRLSGGAMDMRNPSIQAV